MAVPHRCNTDTTLRGYNIPEGTSLMLNTYNVHMNPKAWPEPEKFKPERWIKDGKFEKQNEFIPFSLGKNYMLIFYSD